VSQAESSWCDQVRLIDATRCRASPPARPSAARTGALRPGLILIGDKGLAGRDFENLVSAGSGCA
jgi:hypothetical protein